MGVLPTHQLRLVPNDVADDGLGDAGHLQPGRGVVAEAVERQLAYRAFH